MKRIYSLLAGLLLSVGMLSAQSFENGTNVASVNVGFGTYGVPVSLSYERGVYDINDAMSIGAGGIIGYGAESESFLGGKMKTSNMLIGAQGNYHYTGLDDLDLYAGLILGYNTASAKWDGKGSAPVAASDGAFLFGARAGARYYFTENFGANAEIGYGIGVLSVGVSYRF